MEKERLAQEIKQLTLCIVHQGDKVLLGIKKRGFGQGKWNGFGGKVEMGETAQQAARRELYEEAGIEAVELHPAGTLDFTWTDKPQPWRVHVFKCREFSGVPAESDEMKPQWFFIHEIPFAKMWPDDQFWMPHFLAGTFFHGAFSLDANDRIISHRLTI